MPEHERRKALIMLIFNHYTRQMPSGRPVPSELPASFIEHMATNPGILEIDRHLEYGVERLLRQ